MVQGAENDLIDIRYYTETTPVIWFRSNEPVEDLNTNILTVDTKAILARDTALTAQTDLGNHVGQAGVAEHAVATTAAAGFMSAADTAKLSDIQSQAQLNVLSPVDAIELISGKVTTLHEHPLATPTLDGYMEAADSTKLAGIASGAQVNNITGAQATALTSGGNADSEHIHGFSVGSEAYTEAVHATTDHTGIPGVTSFPGFVTSSFNMSSIQINPGVMVFNQPYGLSSLECLSAGFQEIFDFSVWGASEAFIINDVSISGTIGTVAFEVHPGVGSGDMGMRVWQVGHGVA